MAKPARRNLASALDDTPAATPEPSPAPSVAAAKAGGTKSREGKSLVGAHLPPQYRRTLRMIAAEEDRTTEELIREALDMFFRKKGVAK